MDVKTSVRRRSGFTLVELVVVMAIVTLLTGLIALSGLSNTTVDAFSEASRIEASLRSLRSAWLNGWSGTYYTNAPSDGTYDANDPETVRLSRLADRNVVDDISRYGDIRVMVDGGHIYIGFAGPWASVIDDGTRPDIRRMLAMSKTPYYSAADASRYTASSPEGIMIRVR